MLLDTMELGSRGLLVAADIFEQFKIVFRQRHSNSSSLWFSSSKSCGSDPLSASVATNQHGKFLRPEKTLRDFCGSESDVQPFTILLMKMLCDLGRFDDLRFLFVVYVKELLGEGRKCEENPSGSTLLSCDAVHCTTHQKSVEVNLLPLSSSSSRSSWESPSVEFFNVYLYAISLTDTFNGYEVQNVERLMKVHNVLPNIVSKLSFFILFLRLGESTKEMCEVLQSVFCDVDKRTANGFEQFYSSDSFVGSNNDLMVESVWPVLRDEVLEVMNAGRTTEFPMLFSRLGHCFQVLFRLHYDAALVRECYELVRKICPERMTSEQLIPYMVLTIANRGTPPHATVDVLQHLEALRMPSSHPSSIESPTTSEAKKRLSTSVSCTSSLSTATTSSSYLSPPLHSEMTILRLLTKCAMDADVPSLEYVLSYLHRNHLYNTPSKHVNRCGSSKTGFSSFRSSPPHVTKPTTSTVHSTTSVTSSGRYDTGIQKENLPVVTLLQIQTYARANRPLEALAVAESACSHLPPSSPCWIPGEEIYIHAVNPSNAEKRLVRLSISTDPVTDLLSALTEGGTKELKKCIHSLDLLSPRQELSVHAAFAASKDEKTWEGGRVTERRDEGGREGADVHVNLKGNKDEKTEEKRAITMDFSTTKKHGKSSAFLDEALWTEGGSSSPVCNVTGVTLQFLLGAAAQLGEVELTSLLLQVYAEKDMGTPSAWAWSSYITATLPRHPSIGVRRVREVLGWMHTQRWGAGEGGASPFSSDWTSPSSRSMALEPVLLSACLNAALTAGEVALALHVCDLGGAHSRRVLAEYGPVLLRLAASTGDPALIRCCYQRLFPSGSFRKAS